MDLHDVGWGGIDYTDMVPDAQKNQALVNVSTKLGVP
jgi:hypothetical protein